MLLRVCVSRWCRTEYNYLLFNGEQRTQDNLGAKLRVFELREFIQRKQRHGAALVRWTHRAAPVCR